MTLTIEQIQNLLGTLGTAQYGGEAVSQLEHALQCAAMAEAAGATPELITACLLHDLGHLLNKADAPTEEGMDDAHQYAAMPFLRGVFPESVLSPIRLHVDAKRYLCAVEPGYWEALSGPSKRSLELQGGRYTEPEARLFMARPYAQEAVYLRRWDDTAKAPAKPTPVLAHFVPAMNRSRKGVAVAG